MASSSSLSAIPSFALSSGYSLPAVGLGVWRAEKGKLPSLILKAIDVGYRHFDCAADYGNEAEVGEALHQALESGRVKREELFITTKLWNSDHGHVREACVNSLKNLRLSYLDLYLVHFPIATKHTGINTTNSALLEDGTLDIDCSVPLHKVWSDMESLVNEGLVRSIGVSNYDIFLLRDCLAYASIRPAVNQVEAHPFFPRSSLSKFAKKNNVLITAHTPLGGGKANEELFKSESPLEHETLKAIASKHGKSPAQIALRWGVQRGASVIPKSNHEERLVENFSIFDFELTNEEMAQVDALDRGARSNNPREFWGYDFFS